MVPASLDPLFPTSLPLTSEEPYSIGKQSLPNCNFFLLQA